MGKIVAVANQKGGVGKTTTAINLASCVGKAGKKVLLVDVDPQCNATSGMGIDGTDCAGSIYECILGERAAAETLVHLPWDCVDLLPATRSLTGAEIELISVEEREYRLTHCLRDIRSEYDFIVIDCPPSLGLLTINALTAAQTVLMPIQCEYYALEGLSQLLETYNLVRRRLNPLLEIEGILLTMVDFRTNLSQQVVSEVRRHFGERVFEAVIPRNVRLGEAPGFGKPIVEYAPESRGAACYVNFTAEFLGRNNASGDAARLKELYNRDAAVKRCEEEVDDNGQESSGQGAGSIDTRDGEAEAGGDSRDRAGTIEPGTVPAAD